MTVTAEQIQIAKGKGFHFVDEIAKACDATDTHFYLALAMLEKETGTGRNVYGHDAGGALSGFPGTVNKDNYAVFKWLVFTKGQTSNGVGPSQLTFKGFFTDMESKGLKPYDPADNIAYGVKLIGDYYRAARNAGLSVEAAIKKAGTRYNGSSSYGDRLLPIALRWREVVGRADYK